MTIQKEPSFNKLSKEAKRLVNLAYSVKDNRRRADANFDNYNLVYDNGKDLIFATDTKQALFINESTGDKCLFNRQYTMTDIVKVDKSDVYRELLKDEVACMHKLYHNKRVLTDIMLLIPFYRWVVFVGDNSYLIPKNEYKDAFELPIYSTTNDLFLNGLSHSNTLVFDLSCFKNLLKFLNGGEYANVCFVENGAGKSHIFCEHKGNHFALICADEPSVVKSVLDRKNTFIFSCQYESEIRQIAFVISFLNKNAKYAGELKREKGLYVWRGYDSKTKEQREEFSFRLPALNDFTEYFLKNIFKGNER